MCLQLCTGDKGVVVCVICQICQNKSRQFSKEIITQTLILKDEHETIGTTEEGGDDGWR